MVGRLIIMGNRLNGFKYTLFTLAYKRLDSSLLKDTFKYFSVPIANNEYIKPLKVSLMSNKICKCFNIWIALDIISGMINTHATGVLLAYFQFSINPISF